MTEDEMRREAEKYANFQCGLQDKKCAHPEQEPYWNYHFYAHLAGQALGEKRGYMRALEEVIELIGNTCMEYEMCFPAEFVSKVHKLKEGV